MANNIDPKKRKRNPNWDETEKTLLRECLKDVLNIIENKCTDTNTNKAKTLSWQKVMQCFNEVNIMERGLTELKQQWRTMKIDAKKCNSDYKKALKATGGGMKPPSPYPEIMEMLPQEFEVDMNQFDSDTISQIISVPVIEIDEVKNNDMVLLIHSPPKTKKNDNVVPLVNQNMPHLIEIYQWGALLYSAVVSFLFLVLACLCFFVNSNCVMAGIALLALIVIVLISEYYKNFLLARNIRKFINLLLHVYYFPRTFE